jgi:hypothetical protein
MTVTNLLCLICGYVAGLFQMWWWTRRCLMNAHNLRVIRTERQGEELLITLGNGARYRGQTTVWHSYPNGERAPTQMEAYLSDVWTREQWKI